MRSEGGAVVELAGLPGSGKSSIAVRLRAQGGRIRTMVMTPSLTPLVRHPAEALRAARWGILQPGLAWPAWAKLCLLRQAQDRLVAAPGTTLVLEEGVVHHSWRTLLRHPPVRDRPWARLVDAGPPLLVLTASRLARHGRVKGKFHAGDTNRQLASGQPDEATWGLAEGLFDEVLSAARRGRRVLEVPTGGDFEDAVRRVNDVIEALA